MKNRGKNVKRVETFSSRIKIFSYMACINQFIKRKSSLEDEHQLEQK